MSDTTPRPDETTNDPTAPPPPPADVEPTEPVERVEPVEAAQPVSSEVPAQPVPAPVPPVASSFDPAYGQFYGQQAPPPLPPGQQPPPGHVPPPPTGQALVPNPMSPTQERTWGTIAHGGTLAATVLSGGTLGFVCALVIYLLQKERGPFVRHHSANALNVQILGAILVIGGIILTVTVIGAIIGIPMIVVGGVYVLIVHIIGAIKANNGEWWSPPMTPQFVK